MKKRTPIKNHQQEIHLINNRVLITFLGMLCLILFLISRLAYLQFSKHEIYTTLSLKNSIDRISVEPTRGLIYDRHGILLAENIPMFSLDVLPYQVSNIPQALAEISKVIPLRDSDIAQFQHGLKLHRKFDEIPLKMRLTESEVARFYENAYRFPGFLIKARLNRYYPFGASLSSVLGYVGRINPDELAHIDAVNYSASTYIGKIGIEKFYEKDLHGQVGFQQDENDVSGEAIRVVDRTKPQAGKNLYLSIDSKLQNFIQKTLNGHRGAIVAIEPSTGQVLAMVSEPSYDPNVFVAGISNDDYKALQDASDKPLYNRALRGLYPLASTIKPFIALEGLNSGLITPASSVWDPGWYQLPNSDHFFRDWWHQGHGHVNLTRAIIVSCDTYFYDLANKLGIDRIDDILTQFGFGQLSGIDLGEEIPGVIASPAWKRKIKGVPWYQGDTVNSGIGQGFMQATPLQLAVGVATMAMHGKRFVPSLLYGVSTTSNNFIPNQPKVAQNVALNDKAYWHIVTAAMQGVITSNEGTGYHFGHATYPVAAKTGTAQVYSKKHYSENDNDVDDQAALPEKLRDHSLFIAFAPVEKPQIALAVVVENSKLASSIARQILDFYLLPSQPSPLSVGTAINKAPSKIR